MVTLLRSSHDDAESSMSAVFCIPMFLLSMVLGFLGPACDSGEDSGSAGTGQTGVSVSEAIEQNLWNGGYYSAGEWEQDFNDGAFYGTAYSIRQGLEQGNTAYVERAGERMAFNAGIL